MTQDWGLMTDCYLAATTAQVGRSICKTAAVTETLSEATVFYVNKWKHFVSYVSVEHTACLQSNENLVNTLQNVSI